MKFFWTRGIFDTYLDENKLSFKKPIKSTVIMIQFAILLFMGLINDIAEFFKK